VLLATSGGKGPPMGLWTWERLPLRRGFQPTTGWADQALSRKFRFDNDAV
jgi:hypothetical protein